MGNGNFLVFAFLVDRLVASFVAVLYSFVSLVVFGFWFYVIVNLRRRRRRRRRRLRLRFALILWVRQVISLFSVLFMI